MSVKHLDFKAIVWEIYVETSYSMNLDGNSRFTHGCEGF